MNYDNMPAGREMDALVAEKVMGIRLAGFKDAKEDFAGWLNTVDLKEYSISISAAWEVFLNMAGRLFSVRRKFLTALQEQTRLPSGEYVAWPDVLIVLRDKMPEAICRAALKAAL